MNTADSDSEYVTWTTVRRWCQQLVPVAVFLSVSGNRGCASDHVAIIFSISRHSSLRKN